MRARILCLLLIILLLAPALQATGQAPEPDVILRCAVRSFVNANPLTAGPESWKVMGLVYEGATARDPVTEVLVPYIAVGSANATGRADSWGDCAVGDFGYSPKAMWKDSSKPETVVFYDFTGVVWHDGVPMTVRDVMFSLHVHALMELDSSPGHPLKDRAGRRDGNYSETHWLAAEKAWESMDGTRAAIRFTLQRPYYSAFEHFLGQFILPYHIWGSTRTNQFVEEALIWCDPGYNRSEPSSWKLWAAERYINSHPVGSGRFAWSGHSGDTISLAAWDRHFHGPGFKYLSPGSRLPTRTWLDGISVTWYQSETRAIMDLESRKLDLLAWNLDSAAFANDPDVVVKPLRGLEMRHLVFNMARPSFGYAVENSHIAPVLRDAGRPLRRAIAHCVDSGGMAFMTSAGTGNTGTFALWANASAPGHDFDPPEAANILAKAGYVLTDPSEPAGEGNWWLGPGSAPLGWAQGGVIEVLVPLANHDRDANAAGSMVVNQMRGIGLNAALVPLEYDMLLQRVAQGDFDMCVLDRAFDAMERARPENYLFTDFHSASIPRGGNLPGYRNASFETVLEAAMAAPDRAGERELVGISLAALAYDMPHCELYYLPMAETYRADSFFGFVDDGSGSLLNPISMASVQKENRNSLRARFMSVPLTTASNTTFPVTVRVSDQDGNPVSGAAVVLEATAGNLSMHTGITDGKGQFTVDFTAPEVPESSRNGTLVIIGIRSATREGYRDAGERLAALTVYPGEAMLLFVDATALQDVITARDFSGTVGFTYIDITVTDEANLPVADATVMIDITGAPMVPEFTTGLTDQDGKLRLRVTAPAVGAAQDCIINITASKVAFISGARQISVEIIPYAEQPPPEQPGVPAAWARAAVLAVVALACLAYLWRRRSRKGR